MQSDYKTHKLNGQNKIERLDKTDILLTHSREFFRRVHATCAVRTTERHSAVYPCSVTVKIILQLSLRVNRNVSIITNSQNRLIVDADKHTRLDHRSFYIQFFVLFFTRLIIPWLIADCMLLDHFAQSIRKCKGVNFLAYEQRNHPLECLFFIPPMQQWMKT